MNILHDLRLLVGVLASLAASASISRADGGLTEGASRVSLRLHSLRDGMGNRTLKAVLETSSSAGTATDLGAVDVVRSVQYTGGLQIVRTELTIRAPTTQARSSGYELFPGFGYYKFHTKVATWDEAYHTCVNEGAHLIVVNSLGESYVVESFMKRKHTITGALYNDWIHGGFHDRGVEGTYLTIFGQPLYETGYVKWRPGKPSNAAVNTELDEDCGAYGKDRLMGDVPCLAKLPFICELHM